MLLHYVLGDTDSVKNTLTGATLKWGPSSHPRGTALHPSLLKALEWVKLLGKKKLGKITLGLGLKLPCVPTHFVMTGDWKLRHSLELPSYVSLLAPIEIPSFYSHDSSSSLSQRCPLPSPPHLNTSWFSASISVS